MSLVDERRPTAAQGVRFPGPLAAGSGYGALVGAGIGVAVPVLLILSLWPVEGDYAFTLDALPFTALIIGFGLLVGAAYGIAVGWIAGFGALLTTRRSWSRRVAVSVLTLVGAALGWLLTGLWWSELGLWENPFGLLVPVMVIIAWFLAPRLPER